MSSFKDALLEAKSNQLPKCIQNLIDVGLLQECETIDGIHYVSFAFQLNNATFYNYRNGIYISDFIDAARVDAMYVGGFAVNDKGKILKGIIYPYYYNFYKEEDCKMFGGNNMLVPYIKGTPQIINKTDNLKLTDFFILNNFFRAYNLATNLSDTWANFVAGKELYTNTIMLCDENGKLYEPNEYNDLTFYGHVKNEKDFQYKYTKKYQGEYITKSNAITVSFVEKKLEEHTISSSIATNIFCVNETNKSRIKSAEINKEGMEYIGKSIQSAGLNIGAEVSNIAEINKEGMKYMGKSIQSVGLNIRTGVSNIANVLNPHHDDTHYF